MPSNQTPPPTPFARTYGLRPDYICKRLCPLRFPPGHWLSLDLDSRNRKPAYVVHESSQPCAAPTAAHPAPGVALAPEPHIEVNNAKR